ncbi:MAG: ThiF family adenylyltransferase [Deltaproteobacteria bacterium]|nr:ThiF family adenylyltransferase [Deltaproteobacteria bacterium]
MSGPVERPVAPLHEGRFARFEAIDWWDQSRIDAARVLLVGVGALGNEVLKNLALLGVGQVVVVDMDRVAPSNLSRSVLFRESDEGLPKAECAARGARRLYQKMRITPLVGNAAADVGLGYFRWADVVVGALDNREARVFVNSACARVGRVWFDGGIEVLHGVVRGFAPPATACYECTMSELDWKLVNQRRSCSLIERRAAVERGVPTTPTTASVIGALQAQEVLKVLHGLDALLGRGFVLEGLGHSSYAVRYPVSPDCGWHEPPPPIEPLPEVSSDTPLATLWEEGAARLGELDGLDLSRELVERLACPRCGAADSLLGPVERVDPERAACPRCGSERVPTFFHSLPAGSELLRRTAREIGLPAWDIVWARRGPECVGLLLGGDDPQLAAGRPPEQPGKVPWGP